jgi:hypothetical protein
MLFQRFFSVDSPKAVKAQKYGWLNAINYMAPHRLAGVGNLCPHASNGCIKLCLGEHSGNAALYPAVLKSRIAKARLLMQNRQAFLKEMTAGIRRARATAKHQKLKLCVRLNGATDIAWERVAPHIFAENNDLQFVDYTKSFMRALDHARGVSFPANYHLTFSRSETNEAQCQLVLAAGGNVAVVFADLFPDRYLGYPVIDGDAHDLRHLDPRGCVIGLSPKGTRAKRDASGFVVR